MKHRLAILAAAVAALAFTAQSANAGGRHHHLLHVSKLTAVSIGVGAASTAGYFAINNWKWNGWDNSSGITRAGAWGMTTIGCMAVAPIVGTVVLDRPLTMREAHVLGASCLVPIIGGWLVNAAYDAHPEWEGGGPKMHEHHRHMKKAKM
ncbi:MAG: hypothetical protein ACREB2_08610 [Pseudolabrys sp.]